MRRTTALVLAGLFLLGACGDDDSSGNGDGDGGAGAGAETTEETTPVPPDIESRLLTIDAFPDDWDEAEESDGESDASAPGCFEDDEDDDRAIARGSASFSGPGGLPQVEHEVTQYDPGEIEDAFAAAMAQLDDCGTLNVDSNGTHFEGEVARLADFPTYGDESMAWQVELEGGGNVITLTVTYVRQGDFGMSLVYTDLESPDVQEIQQYTALAAAKL